MGWWRQLTRTLTSMCALVLLAAPNASGDDDEQWFRLRIAPVLSAKCVSCHRADNAKGNLDLTTRESTLRGGVGDVGLNFESPHTSPIYARSLVVDGEAPEMPENGEPLTAEESAALLRWIEKGAFWPEGLVLAEKPKGDKSWWAFQPLMVASAQTAPQSIDDFVRAKLTQHGLTASPEADRRTLIRRLCFDLHGLPPSPESVEAFVNDPDPHAYEKLVDQLLASPLYGERYAQHWLDIAHYADTHGFERDQRRDNAWHYRDYVIRSFNENKPYDRFLQEQIAGDVLWPEDEQAVIATGFLSAGPWDFVGQVETQSPELRRSARALDLDDMVTQVMTATMAMTVNCARCHDHKLDPISQQEYYQLKAVFAGIRRAERVVSETRLKAFAETKDRLIDRRNEIDSEIATLEGQGLSLADIVGGGNGRGTGESSAAIDPRTGRLQERKLGQLDDVTLNRFTKCDHEFVDGVFIPNGMEGTAQIPISSTGLTVTGLPTTSGNAWDQIRNGPVNSQHSPELGGIDFSSPGYTLLGLHANAGITFDLTAIRQSLANEQAQSESDASKETQDQLDTVVLRFTASLGYFGAVGGFHADAWVFIDGNQAAHFPQLKREDGLQSIDLEIGPNDKFLTLVATDGGNGFSMDQIGFGNPQILFAMPPTKSDADRMRLTELRQQRDEIAEQLSALSPPPKVYGVVAEGNVPDVRLLTRGDPETPVGEPLRPTALSALSMLEPSLGNATTNEGARRAALAKWITHPQNPLTPRVIVNRMWHWHFGKGLVDTPSDFGFGGSQPSHAELLDWLAGEVQRRNGSLKEIHRLILNSQTYRQVSYARPGTDADAAKRIDADNRLLWRQNARRIEAESIRDAVLYVSGKLNADRGGPGFEDFRYEEAYAPIYTYVTADDPKLWRRSIYRYRVRTTPSRFLTTLDCPDPANLTPNRLTTTTPLQSLALYNNDFMLRQARYLAERITFEAGETHTAQVERAFQLVFQRKPTPQEAKLAEDLIEDQGLFTLCRALLNSNEFVYVD